MVLQNEYEVPRGTYTVLCSPALNCSCGGALSAREAVVLPKQNPDMLQEWSAHNCSGKEQAGCTTRVRVAVVEVTVRVGVERKKVMEWLPRMPVSIKHADRPCVVNQ